MKLVKYLLPLLILLSITGCSSVTRTTEVNVNSAAENSSGTAEIQPNSAVEQAQNDQAAPPEAIAPDAVIKDLYKIHGEDFKNSTDRILNGNSRTYIDKYFDKNLGNLIWKDLTSNKNEVGVIDFDLFYNTQDAEIKNLVVGQAKIEGDKASVPATFTNYGRKENLTYLLSKQNGEWKISDIKYGKTDSLLKYFKEDAQNNNSNNTGEGNFEGTYKIGNTTATVKPIKMAFELKWAKGTGTMIFFYSGQGVLEYESEDKGNGVDKFIFDDTSFTTGKFIRGSDGKEMPVKKIK